MPILRVYTRGISRLCTADTASTRGISGFVTVDIPPVLQVLRGSVLRVLQVLAVFRPLVLLVLRILAVLILIVLCTKILSIYAQHTRSMEFTWTICAPWRQVHAHCFAKNIHRDGPTSSGSWSKYTFSGGQLKTTSEYRQHFGTIY